MRTIGLRKLGNFGRCPVCVGEVAGVFCSKCHSCLKHCFCQPATPHNCPACPTEIRNLYAVAHNLVSLVDRGGSPCKITDRIESLRRAVQEVQPLVDEHFKGEGN